MFHGIMGKFSIKASYKRKKKEKTKKERKSYNSTFPEYEVLPSQFMSCGTPIKRSFIWLE